MNDDLLPEPTRTYLHYGGTVEGYTADQMHAYAIAAIAAERERCAKSLEDAADKLLASSRSAIDRHTAGVLRSRAAAIRSGS